MNTKNVKRGRGRPKLTWVESVKRDLKDWNISKEIALDRSAWRLAINVPEPWTYFFRVSSLAYPNLLGKKGYVESDMPIVLCIFNLLFTVPLGTYCLQVSKNRFQPQLIVYNAGKTSWMVFDWANWRYFSPINSYLHKHKPLKQPAGLTCWCICHCK